MLRTTLMTTALLVLTSLAAASAVADDGNQGPINPGTCETHFQAGPVKAGLFCRDPSGGECVARVQVVGKQVDVCD